MDDNHPVINMSIQAEQHAALPYQAAKFSATMAFNAAILGKSTQGHPYCCARCVESYLASSSHYQSIADAFTGYF